MKEKFEKLASTIDYLLGPSGCPWDRSQTLKTLRSSIIEEAYELIDAINNEDMENIIEEIGDVLRLTLLLCKISEKKKYFTTKDVLKEADEKVIRRHPHVFGDRKAKTLDEAEKIWQEVKKTEKKVEKKIDIPHSLPPLARAQKLIKTLRKNDDLEPIDTISFNSEREVADYLWEVLISVENSKIDASQALLTKISEEIQKRL